MTADPYARLDAVYLLGALDADERLAYEAHLAICRRAGLVAHGADGATHDLGSRRLTPGQRVIFTSGTALTETQIKNLQITQPTGPPSSPWGALLLPDCGSLVGPRPVAWPRHMRICVRGGTRRAR